MKTTFKEIAIIPAQPKHLTTEYIRKAYRDLRVNLGLTLRDASAYLGVDSSTLSLIEHGPIDPLLQDKTQQVDAICHVCHNSFKAHPLYMGSEPVVFPYWVCDKCKK